MIYPAIEEDIKWWENDDDDNIQLDANERKDYERRVRANVRNLKHQREEINRNLFDKDLEIILNHNPPKQPLLLKEYDKMWKDSNNLDSYIDGLERKIELEFQPLPSKSKVKPKPKSKPVMNVNPIVPIRVHEDFEIPNGLLGVRRDLFNKLAAYRWAQDEDLQQRYRISKGDLFFKDYFLFKHQRAQKPKPHK
jgi:hypothetical protein